MSSRLITQRAPAFAAPAFERSGEGRALPLSLRLIWQRFWAQPWSFKWTCIYVFFEYVRPQQVYPVLQFAPWALLTLGAALASSLMEGRSFRAPRAPTAILLGMTLLILASSAFAFVPEESFKNLDVWANWLLVYFLIVSVVTNPERFYLFMVLFVLWSTKMSQHGARAFMLTGGGASGAPGWFQNTGEFALQMCIYVPITFYLILALSPRLPRWKIVLLSVLPIMGMMSILGSGSRGGQLAIALVGLLMLLRSRHKFRGLMAIAVVAPLLWFALPQEQKDRFSTAGKDKTSVSRLAYWKAGLQMAKDHPVLGVGYNNWARYYLANYPPSKGGIVFYGPNGEPLVEASHNSFVEVVSQLGYPGLMLFAGALVSVCLVNADTRRKLGRTPSEDRVHFYLTYALDSGVAGFVVAGFFMAVAFYPFVWFQLAMSVSLNRVVSLQRGSGQAPPLGASQRSAWSSHRGPGMRLAHSRMRVS